MSMEILQSKSDPAPLSNRPGWRTIRKRRPAAGHGSATRRSDVALLLLLFCVIVSTRLLTLGLYPLIDKSESRYAEVSREMKASRDLVVPRLMGEPFMAKPPLAFWLCSASMALLGETEFAARLPSFLLLLLTAALTFALALDLFDVATALFATVILCSMPLHFVLAGTVLTDPALGLCVTLSCSSFILVTRRGRSATGRMWGLFFFAGLGMGLLAKGPVAVALTLIPVGAWTVLARRWHDVRRALPWVTGPLLTLLIATPWFVLMERRIPGYLEYFFVGENIRRFVVPGWGGDLYGHVHQTIPGTIWIYWLLAAFPWTLVLLAGLWRRRRWTLETFRGGPQLFLLFWALSPLILFTLSRSAVVTYVFPGLPALALLVALTLRAGPPEEAPC